MIEAEISQVDEREFLGLLPLKNVVILPKSIIPVIVGRSSSIKAVEKALKDNKELFVTTQKNPNTEKPTVKDVFEFGTRSKILQVMRMPNKALKILVEGISRARIVESKKVNSHIAVYCEDIQTNTKEDVIEIEALWRALRGLYKSYSKLNEKAPPGLDVLTKDPEEISSLADIIAVNISNLTIQERQDLLETVEIVERLKKLNAFLKKEIDVLRMAQRIRGQVQTQVEKSQREYYLTEQIKAIQKELGREDQSTELNQIREKVKSIKLTQEAKEKVEKELKRLEQMPPLSSEAVVSRHYIDWLISLPWSKTSKDRISLSQAEKILNKSHAGLKRAKERIIEFIAAKKFSKNLQRSPIICLVGPPGVGKTSLGQSIATSLGREFARISLGGIRDEAEIRGHRRTYIGALPGKIIQAMKKAKTVNPVILLDEIDKLSRDVHGDPAAALLEVLDPEQNHTFVDHFLDVEYDLSKVMFITTANMAEGIPYALYDRMEIIYLSGYTEPEKKEIARKFLIPKNLKEYDLTSKQFNIPDEQLSLVVNEYTKEAGVRQLERILTKLMRKAIQEMLKEPTKKSVKVTSELLKKWLGYPKYTKTSLDKGKDRIGLSTGLAWTEVGGDILEIETTVIPGKGSLTITGQIGEVMRESAHAALSYIRSRAKELGLKNSFYSDCDIHIHVPEGAIPKDGPSAGITMCTSLISALTKKNILENLAMTGEITLRGRVLAIGGVKEKLLAAKQHNMKTVILPEENKNDIEEVKKEINFEPLKLILVKTMDDVIVSAFAKDTFKKSPSTKKRIVKKTKK